MSSSRDDLGRQNPADSGATAPTKQVKPVGMEQSAEASPARDSGKSDVAAWEAVFERENMLTALKRVERNKGAAGVDGMEVQDLSGYLKLKANSKEVREAFESGKYPTNAREPC